MDKLADVDKYLILNAIKRYGSKACKLEDIYNQLSWWFKDTSNFREACIQLELEKKVMFGRHDTFGTIYINLYRSITSSPPTSESTLLKDPNFNGG